MAQIIRIILECVFHFLEFSGLNLKSFKYFQQKYTENTKPSFKSKYIIERQSSLLKKLQAENNIVKNERNQLQESNKRLVTKLRSRCSLIISSFRQNFIRRFT